MPVQINEVIIRAIVESNGPVTSPAETVTAATSQTMPDMEIAEQVLEIIKEKNER
jgi:hypothetical protein